MKSHGVSDEQISQLYKLYPALCALCESLAKYNIPECLNHSDYHENNMLFDNKTQKVSIIDLGETAINHPFFSLAALLKLVKNRYPVKSEDTDYLKIQDACFNEWVNPSVDFKNILGIVEKLLPIYLTFAQMRLINATCPDELKSVPCMKDRIKEGVEWFIRIADSK